MSLNNIKTNKIKKKTKKNGSNSHEMFVTHRSKF